jgi:signal transduction histidine kinase
MVTTVTLSDPHSGRREILATLMDLSRVRQINEQMQQSDKLSSLGTLAAGVAHEIRNPLASLRGLTQLLAEDLSPEDPKQRYVKVILGEVDRLNSVVQQLLDFSAVSREEKARVDLNGLIQNALQLAKSALKKKPEVRVELQLAESLPPVGVYERKIVQALLNLILNAIEAVDDQGVVRIETRMGKGRVEVEIANTGSYIDPEQQERIFDPFFTTKDGGTGLGLAITHQIARQHDGFIEVRSTREEGTAFTLSIPDKALQNKNLESVHSGKLSSPQPQRL